MVDYCLVGGAGSFGLDDGGAVSPLPIAWTAILWYGSIAVGDPVGRPSRGSALEDHLSVLMQSHDVITASAQSGAGGRRRLRGRSS